ncbi:hypothetical protein LWI28_010956 [Acer negundo]|uniref:Uncharacterized protein n=1 Tax=Acer negundo TaxID=4023 RepID=A0AAD5NIT1_ACENE|nr:hypothetical protein LWI28_010956 [Acer negundo]
MGLEGILIEIGEGKKAPRDKGQVGYLASENVCAQSDMECSGSLGINNCVSVLIGSFDTVHVENKDKKKKEENKVGKGVGIINGLGLVGQAGQPQNPSIIECDIAQDRNSVLSLDEKQVGMECLTSESPTVSVELNLFDRTIRGDGRDDSRRNSSERRAAEVGDVWSSCGGWRLGVESDQRT